MPSTNAIPIVTGVFGSSSWKVLAMNLQLSKLFKTLSLGVAGQSGSFITSQNASPGSFDIELTRNLTHSLPWARKDVSFNQGPLPTTGITPIPPLVAFTYEMPQFCRESIFILCI